MKWLSHFKRPLLWLRVGSGGFSPFDFVDVAMGSRGRGALGIDWESLDTETLAHILTTVWAILRARLTDLTVDHPPPPVPSEPRDRRPSQVAGARLLTPERCEYHCLYCEERCTRRPGHTFHSCWEHRRRRQ